MPIRDSNYTRNKRSATSPTNNTSYTRTSRTTTTPVRKKLITKRATRKAKSRITSSSAVKGAENRLKNFRQASILAVAITGFIMLLLTPGEAALPEQDTIEQVEQLPDTLAAINEFAVEDVIEAETTGAEVDTIDTIASTKEAAGEAIGALQSLWEGFFYNLPKILIALGGLALAWGLVRLVRLLLQKTIGHWHSSGAIMTLVSIAIWLFSIGVALSVVAGDIRALVGSFGLIGLALSWSLQTPIESFTGWLLNSFQGYYRVGDRIKVGDVFGDVYRIDFLTTTVWEIGGPYSGGFVQAEQPTGRMVTFPNNEILSGTVINLTGDFPFVWDELSVAVANESDLGLSMEVLERLALELLGDYMITPAQNYSKLVRRAGLGDSISEKPQVFLSMDDSWTNITIRYLVGARERRKWKSSLTFRITKELNKPEYVGKIIPVYPRQQVQFINPDGVPVTVKSFSDGKENED